MLQNAAERARVKWKTMIMSDENAYAAKIEHEPVVYRARNRVL